MQRQDERLTVTVFGAGISGLTAAHELAVRGFKVQVIDKELNEWIRPTTLDRGVGGIARSQWACWPPGEPFPRKSTPVVDGREPKRKIPALRSTGEFMYDDTLVFEPDGPKPARPADAALFVTRVKALLAKHVSFSIRFCTAPGQPPDLLEARMHYLQAELGLDDAAFADLAFAQPIDPELHETGPMRDWVFATPGVRPFPAEHGFRFFPSFYRHLFDTMKRTPVIDPFPSEHGVRTAFDNLVPVEELGFARGGKKRSFVLPRHPVRSFERIRIYLKEITEQLGYTYDDLAQFELALFQYMTTCTARREREYEHISWSDFLHLERFSPVCRRHLEYGPQMALGLRGSKSDARTQGNIVTQLLRDQVLDGEHQDGTLDGPTSSAWFQHWQSFLEHQDVEFFRGTLDGFEVAGDRIVPMVAFGDAARPIESSYYVIAFSLQEIDRLVDSFLAAARQVGLVLGEDSDFHRVRRFAGPNLENDLRSALPDGPLQHLAGIQFYFDTELKFWRAHTQYLDSPWSLSSISQTQFWGRPRDPTDNFRSVLSVDIGDWSRTFAPPPHDGATPEKPQSAWKATPDDIARLTWAQVYDHHDQAFFAKFGDRARFPRPIAYALDQRLACSGTSKVDSGGYLVPQTGKYRTRPGALSDGIHAPKGQSRYQVTARYVLAGTYMQTFTRLTSMESANESARHAVNAILDHAGVASDRCDIWDMEDCELDDLAWFKDLDHALFERRSPHLVETLGWRELPAVLPSEVSQLSNILGGKR